VNSKTKPELLETGAQETSKGFPPIFINKSFVDEILTDSCSSILIFSFIVG